VAIFIHNLVLNYYSSTAHRINNFERGYIMQVILIKWFDGVNWDTDMPSMFNPNKKKSATEHLIETGGLDVDEAIESFDRFKDYPLVVSQYKLASGEVNWITKFIINEKDNDKVESIKKELLENYTKKQAQLLKGSSGYRIEIEETTVEELLAKKENKSVVNDLNLKN
jgi:hypothetical protein